MRNAAKRILHFIAPRALERLQARRARRHVTKLMNDWGATGVARAFTDKHGWSVRAGPFQGMQLIDDITWSGLVPKLLGSYEREIADDLEALVKRPYDVVVDVGCADGYYAVGLARRLPNARIIAFDLDPEALRTTKALAERNGVSARVELRGRCDADVLNQTIQARRSLVFSDCEGFEDTLLDPIECPALRGADIVVEMHDHAVPGVTERISARLAATHDVIVRPSMQRDPKDYPILSELSPADQSIALAEFRPEQQWCIFRARSQTALSS